MSAMTSEEPVSRWRQLLVWLAFIALDTGTQIAFKWGADGLGDMDFGLDMLARSVTLPGVWFAIIGYLGTFVVWMAILRDMPLSRAFPMTGLVYVTVPLLAWATFGEQIDLLRAGGIALIIVGVILLGSEHEDEQS
ncbi:EamA family transporter [Bosea minatitlanensis]|uniref:EamA family transporter n=1 Tax=Bosea minatitlanensis TaxID=128782 RepID=A0ABW0F1P6_9HYPH|nr:EamA family transporter [Bosea minatitlanensis]MCT4495611.1 EamA family transporter [Bosea minatitlanensis]